MFRKYGKVEYTKPQRPNGATSIRNGTNKECYSCLDWLPESNFSRDERMPDHLNILCRFCMSLKRRGITKEIYFNMLETQGGVCAICKSNMINPSIDHNHDCCRSDRGCQKCFRGILCRECNLAIGLAKENPIILRSAALYLEATKI